MDSIISTASSTAEINFCFLCKTATITFDFCCSHKICSECLVKTTLRSLQNFYSILKRDLTILNGKSSSLGCPLHCPASELCLSLRHINTFAQSSPSLSPADQLFFSQMTDLGASFFSGIKTYFLLCINCREIKFSQIPQKLLCRSCLEKLLQRNFNAIPGYRVLWENDKEKVNEFQEKFGICNLYLAKFDSDSSSYVFERIEEDLKIEKFQLAESVGECILIQAIPIEDEASDYLIVSEHDMVGLISILAVQL